MVFHKYDKPKEGPYHPAHFFTHGVIVQVFTDEGIVGLGATPDSYWHIPPVYVTWIEKILKPQLIGKDPYELEVILKSLMKRGRLDGAVSAIELALWDIIGKSLNLPLYKLLGGAYRDKVKVYGSKIVSHKPEEAAKEALDLAERGFKAAKVQMGELSFERDLARIKAIREAVDDLELTADVNGRYTLTLAIKAAKELEKYDLVWLEEPISGNLNPTTVSEYARLSSSVNLNIAGGEGLYGIREAKDAIKERAVSIIQHNVQYNGIIESRKICAMAEAFDIPWAPSCIRLGIGVVGTIHLAANTPNFMMMEYWKHPGTEELRSGILTEPIEMKKGYIEVPKKPGLGIELNEDKLAKYTIKHWNVSPYYMLSD